MSSPYDSYSYTRSVNTLSNNSNKYHSRSSSESLLFTPPLSPTEEQLLAFLIPDIEPSELAAYLSAPATPILSDVSCLIGKNLSSVSQTESCYNIEAVYPSPVCAAAAATVVAMDRLDCEPFPSLSVSPSTTASSAIVTPTAGDSFHAYSSLTNSKKRSSMYAFVGSDDEEDKEEMPLPDFASSPTVYVMSSRNTRKRLMLEQAFVSPDEEEDNSPSSCYSQIFHGASSDELDMTSELSSTLAFDLVLV